MPAMAKKPTPRQRAKAALKDLRQEAGGDAAIAKAIGLTKQAVGHWAVKGVVPEGRLAIVSKVFEKDPKTLRPDLPDLRIKLLLRDAA